MNISAHHPPQIRITVRLSDIEPLEVSWLWKPYLPIGMLALLSGDPGSGKTYLSLAIAAELSNGKIPFSGETCEPKNILYLSRENSTAHVVRPRFDSLGGDCARFHILEESITLDDTYRLNQAVAETGSQLVIIDPLQSYLGPTVDAYRANETRPILDELAETSRFYGCCILLIRHLTKGSGGRAIHRGQGSIDFTGAARSELLAGTAQDEPDNRAMIHIKSNIGPYGDPLGYSIGPEGFNWTGKTDLTPRDLLTSDSAGMGPSKVALAAEWLKTALAPGPKLQAELVATNVHPEWALQKAAKLLGLKRLRAGESGAWIWKLPEP